MCKQFFNSLPMTALLHIHSIDVECNKKNNKIRSRINNYVLGESTFSKHRMYVAKGKFLIEEGNLGRQSSKFNFGINSSIRCRSYKLKTNKTNKTIRFKNE